MSYSRLPTAAKLSLQSLQNSLQGQMQWRFPSLGSGGGFGKLFRNILNFNHVLPWDLCISHTSATGRGRFSWVRAGSRLTPCLRSTSEKTGQSGKGKGSTKGRKSGGVLDLHLQPVSRSLLHGNKDLSKDGALVRKGDEKGCCFPREGAGERQQGQNECRNRGGLASGTPGPHFSVDEVQHQGPRN